MVVVSYCDYGQHRAPLMSLLCPLTTGHPEDPLMPSHHRCYYVSWFPDPESTWCCYHASWILDPPWQAPTLLPPLSPGCKAPVPPPPPRLLNLRGTFIIQLLSVIPYDCFIPADNEWYNFVYFAM